MMHPASKPRHRILVIDDNLAIHDDFRKVLAEPKEISSSLASIESELFGVPAPAPSYGTFEIDYVTQGQAGLERVQQALAESRPYALAFVDGRMPPGWDGIETISQLWQASPDLQVVLCTAYADYSWQEIQQHLGTSDSLVILKKPFDNVEVLQLAHALTRKWELNRLVQGKLHRLAYYDSLTDLPNRVLFMDLLSKALTQALQGGQKGALLFIDLDNFKRINDTLGHHVGDKLLTIIAKRLAFCVRDTDSISYLTKTGTTARLGGDEFSILLTELEDECAAGLVARRVSSCLSEPVELGEQQVMVTPSIGIACFPRDGNSVATLLKKADLAMYCAKREGPNRFKYFKETMDADALRRLNLEIHLRKALELEELSLHYQPQFDLASGQLSGLEALLRWHNPTLGTVSPLEIIPLAEDNGMIIPIGEWVVRTACRQAQQWIEQGLRVPRISINVSMQQFIQPNFLSQLRQILTGTGLDPQKLQIEITESLLHKDPGGITALFTSLDKMNVQIAIDDFGTGYSNLSRLQAMPIDCLKIDRLFVKNIEGHKRNQAILSSMIAMAQSMELNVIAEGVETLAQRDFLIQKGCQEAQGYLLSLPLDQEQTEDFLQQLLPANTASA
ncbi:MAG: EAL domain-containing protein [Desulfuromonadaceae bacterium]